MRKYLLAVVLLIPAGAVTWWYFWSANDRVGCLAPNEYAEYEFEDNDGGNKPSYVTVFVKNLETENTVRSFRHEITQAGHYHPVELHNCSYYLSQSKNYNYELREGEADYTAMFSGFDYLNNKTLEIVIGKSGSGSASDYKRYYKNDFRVAPSEDYILLLKGIAGAEDDPFAIVVKDTETLDDKIVVPIAKDMQEQEIFASHLQPIQWTDDSRYVWVRISATSLAQGWVRIDTKNWSYDVYKAPEGIMNGYVLNLETGWVPLIPDSFFSGIVEMDEIIREERAAAGERAVLYLYNIFTEEQVLVEQTNEPIWQNLAAVWRDNQTLEYSSPSGERKTYRLEE